MSRETTNSANDQAQLARYRQLIGIRQQNPVFRDGALKFLLTDDANKIYSFGRMDQKNRIAVILNQDSRSHTVTISAYQLSMTNGSSVTDQLTGSTYQVQNGQVMVDVQGEGGVVLVQ